MPRIPTYNSPQVESRALPGVRQSSVASPSLFGAGAEQEIATGRGLMQAGTGIAAAANLMQDRENADLLFRAETALKDEYLTFEDDVHNNRRGQGAWGVTKDAEKFFADQEKKHSDILTNDVQRQLFNRTVTKLRQQALGTFSRYEADQRIKSSEEAERATIASSISIAARHASRGLVVPPAAAQGPVEKTVDADGNEVATAPPVTVAPDPIMEIKDDIRRRVGVIAGLNKHGDAWKRLEEEKHITLMHKQVISNLVDKDPTRAREYFKANKEEINGGEYDQIGKVLMHGETKQAGFAFAERDDIRQLSEADALTAARDFFKDDPEKREAAIREIKTRAAEATQMRERGQRDAADQAWGVYGRTGNLNDIPASLLASMDGKDYAALKEHAAAKAAGKGVVTDFATYYDLRQMAANSPEDFRKVDLRRYIGKLSPGDLEEMAKLQTGKGTELKDAATLSQQLSNTHDLLKWGSGDKEKKGAFDKAVTDAVNTEQKRRGKELTYEERQALIDRLVIEGDVNGMWPGGGRRYYEVQSTPDAAKFSPKIPDADKQTIVERFQQRAGRKPTDAEIMQTFKKWKGL